MRLDFIHQSNFEKSERKKTNTDKLKRLLTFLILCNPGAKMPPPDYILQTFASCLSIDNALELLDFAQLHSLLKWLGLNGMHESDLLTAEEIKQIHNGGL